MLTSTRKFLLNKLDESDDDESSNLELELPTRRRFISLTKEDLFAGDGGEDLFFKIDDDENDEMISCQISGNDEEQIREDRKNSMRQSKTNNKLMDKTIQKIFEEQNKMREEMQKKFKHFNEYKEIENIQKEMEKKQEHKLEQEEKLKEEELEKEEERKESLERLEKEKEIELEKIKEIISSEFSKRDNELTSKQKGIENLKQVLKEQIMDQENLNDKLKHKSSENEELINNLKNKVSELQNNQENEENKEEITLTESKIEDVEMKQEEILKAINNNIELQGNLENKQKELEDNEMELKEEQKNLEIEKKQEIHKRSKNAYKKFDIRRANIIMECEIDFQHIRERKSLLNTDDMMQNIKLKMRKQFKQEMMKLRLQLNNNKSKNNKLQMQHIKISNSFFGNDEISFQCSPNNEMCACLGINGVFHIIDIKSGEGVYLHSLNEIICNYQEEIEIKTIHMEWDKNSVLVGVLLVNCKWIGIWNSLTQRFYEFSVDDCNDIITSFGWSTNKLLLGMNNGDIYIKDMHQNPEEESKLIKIPNKMLNKIDICKWSTDNNFAIVVNDTHIAIINDIGVTVERIASKRMINDVKCDALNGKNVLTVISSNNLIFHGINDKTKRKRMTFDENFGSIINHCWCHDSLIVGFENGNIIVVNAKTCNNRYFECGKTMKDVDAVYFPNLGYIIAMIDDKCIRFLKLIGNINVETEWELIAIIDYTDSEWIVKDEIPTKIQLTSNGKHSIVCFFCLSP